MKTKEPKTGKKEILYDILGGEKKYYVGRIITYPDGNRMVNRITGYYPSETEAAKNK